MITPYGQPPTDSYSTDDAPAADNLDWQVHRPQPSPIVPYISMPPGSASPELSAAEARRQRQAITFRMLIALAMAVPLTAIAAAASEGTMGGLASLLAMALTWVGIAAVVYLSHGKNLPGARGPRSQA